MRGVAGPGLALVALIAAMPPAAAQGQPQESARPPDGHQPLAVAYLAAPFAGGPSGRAVDLSFGKLSVGDSIIARFLPSASPLQPWEGIPFGLFKRTGSPGAATQLGESAGRLGFGTGKPLDLKLHAFLPPEQLRSPLKLLTYESDAWKARRDTFSVLSDTTFVLTGAPRSGGPMGSDPSVAAQRNKQAPGQGGPSQGYGTGPGGALQGRDNAPRSGPGYGYDSRPKSGPGFGYDSGPKAKPGPYPAPPKAGSGSVGADSIACVNKRTAPKDGRSLSCSEGSGEVIEDPLSGEPALLMYPPEGPPSWLKAVPTEICADGAKTPSINVPIGATYFPVALSDRRGKLLCTRAALSLDYVTMRQSGIEVDGVKHYRLDSRSAAGAGWKLQAEAPSRGRSGGWMQRIVLVSSAPSVASAPAPKLASPPHVTRSPDAEAPPQAFAVLLSEWRWKLSLAKLWYGPLPAGSDGSRPFKCESGGITIGQARWGRDKLVEAAAVAVSTVLKLPPGLRLDVMQPPTRLQPVGTGFVLLAESSSGEAYCGIATPRPGSTELEGKLQPEGPPPVVAAEMEFRREGPAALTIEHVSQGRAVKLAELDAPSFSKALKWRAGDKIRVRPVDPDFQGVSAVKVDGAAVAVSDDRSVEITLTEQTRIISIQTVVRPVGGFVTVATPKGAVDVTIAGGKSTFAPDAQPRKLHLPAGVKLGEEVTVAPKEAGRLSVVKLTLRSGSSQRTVEGATFKLERGDMPGGKLDLHIDVEMQANDLALPAELLLKPVVHLGKRQLAFSSCKVTLAGFPAQEFIHERDGRTRVKVGIDKRARSGVSYRIAVGGTAAVCRGFEAEAVQAQKLAALAKGEELAVPVRRPTGRAFVGILSWPLGADEVDGNLRAALKALADTFDTGASEGRYLWGAIYASDGKRLVASETADYAPMEVLTPERIGRFKAGSGALRYEDAVKSVLAEVADLEGAVDLMVVASGVDGAYKWTHPFASAATRGARSGLVRVIKAAPGQSSDPSARARLCDVAGEKDAVGMAVEVAVEPSVAGGASDRLLREALDAASRSLAAPPSGADAKVKAKKADVQGGPPANRRLAG